MPRLVFASLALALLLSCARAHAQSDLMLQAAVSGPLLGDEQALEEERAPAERFRESSDPHEEPGRRYFFLGAGWRFVQLPPWLMRAYTVRGEDAIGSTTSVFGELAYRRSGFQVTANVGYAKLDFDGPFRLAADPIEDTEWLEGRFNFLVLSSAITWSTSFSDWFQLEYGLEAGLALLFGGLTRTEAVRSADGRWGKCRTWASLSPNPADVRDHNPLLPNPTPEERRYCDVPLGGDDGPPLATDASDEEGAHYGVEAKRGLRHGGVPSVLPILGPRLSLRFKPAHQLVLRVDVPLPVIPFGFMGGVSAQYGF